MPARARPQTPFSDPENEPFFWRQGKHAALLIHGFGGTPAEMRPLGVLLQRTGWAVHAPLLPGFGAEIETLAQRDFHEWIDTVWTSYDALTKGYEKVLLVGNSMGAALALVAAKKHRPAGMVLVAPFLRFAVWWHNLCWPVLSRFLPQLRPFQHADFSSPQMRRIVRRLCNNADPDAAYVQESVRAIRLSIRALDQLRQVGRLAYAAAPHVRAPTLILQGRHDLLVTPNSTRALVRRLPTSPRYLEFDGGHDLVEPEGEAWQEVTRQVLHFARDVADRQTKHDQSTPTGLGAGLLTN
jgi:carboxylesterase